MRVDRRRFPRRTFSYRLGHFLVLLSERQYTRVALSLSLGVFAGAIEAIAHSSLEATIPIREVAILGDTFIVSSFVFLLTYVELSAVRERRLRVVRDIKKVADLNHHVRNALEAIQYAAYTSTDKSNLALVNASVDRIDNILHDLYPALEIEHDIHRDTAPR